MKERRLLVFATDKQLTQLAVSRPFQQLLSVSTFVRSGDCAKQVPLVFVMMSGRRKSDYKKVNNGLIYDSKRSDQLK